MNRSRTYCGLHNHTDASNFRLLDSTNKLPDLLNTAHELGMSGVAITEHETIESSLEAIEFYYDHKDEEEWKDFKVILGNEIYLCQNTVCEENKETMIYPHFILLALDAIGHEQIREISTKAWSRAFSRNNMMRVPTYYEDLVEIIGNNKGHVVGSTACIGGALARQILSYKAVKNETIYKNCIEWIEWMKDLFGEGHFFLEMQPSYTEEQQYVNKMLLQLSKTTNTPYIITTDAHYLRPEDREIHKLFLNSDNDGDREVDEFYASTYLMTEAEIHEYLNTNIGYEAVEQGLENTTLIYDMVQPFDLRKPLHIPYRPLDLREPDKELVDKYKDKVPLLKHFYKSDFNGDRHLVRDITEAVDKDDTLKTEKAIDNLNECLDSIVKSDEKMKVHWSAYLEQMSCYIKLLWQNGFTIGAGRGSALGFSPIYMLGITQINPTREKTKTYPFRFLNPERASVLDIDFDSGSSQRDNAIQLIKDTFGEDRVSKVMTITKVQSRSALLIAARGLGIDNDIAQYMASLIVADRGQTRSLHTMYYGDDDNDGVGEFKSMMDDYPELWNLAQKIEGLISGVGSHASGLVIVDEPFTKSTALMKTNNGDTITQFDLHKLEEVSLIKIDLLSTDAIDKIETCLKLLIRFNKIEEQPTWKETYEKYVGVYNLERDSSEMWDLLAQHKVLSFFQMEKQSGIQAISLAKPNSVDDLATINAVMRLMPPEGATETPLEKFARFKKDYPNAWIEEMNEYGLTEHEQKLLIDILGVSYGICAVQEYLMILVMQEEMGGFNLSWADKLRKAVAKKKPKQFMELQKEYFTNMEEKHLSKNLCNYVWNVLIATQKGYGFNSSHTLSYSMIGLQELNLYYRYNPIYWNTAVLIVDSGSLEDSTKSTNYGKVATAIASVQKQGVDIALPLINEAERGFLPDEKNNRIIYSFKSLNGIGDDVVTTLLANRPYQSMEDFYTRMIDTGLVKTGQMVMLIKCGAFTELDNIDRVKTMHDFIVRIAEPKNKLTGANFAKVDEYGIMPEKLQNTVRIYKFKDYVLFEDFLYDTIIDKTKKIPKCGYHDRLFKLNQTAMSFFISNFSEDSIEKADGVYYVISEKKFLKEWKQKIQPLMDWFASDEALKAFNDYEFNQLWLKHAEGNLAHWEMQSMSCYYTEHELVNLQEQKYGVVNYFDLPEEPVPYDYYYRYFTNSKGEKEKKAIPKNQIVRIAGAVLDNNNDHHDITLLTVYGTVTCKFNKGAYAAYNRQISAYLDGADKKTILEKSWFKRGNLLLVAGYRDGDIFRVYRYTDTIYLHTVNKITKVHDDGTIEVQSERIKV